MQYQYICYLSATVVCMLTWVQLCVQNCGCPARYMQMSYDVHFMPRWLSIGILQKSMITLKALVELHDKNKLLLLTKNTANAFVTTFLRVV